MSSIFDTIKVASQELSIHDCLKHGHKWDSEGQGCRSCTCNNHLHYQTVFVCSECGEMDYGEPGGPGHDECLELGCKEIIEEFYEYCKEYDEGKLVGYEFSRLCEHQARDFDRRLATLYIK